jgi:hypothetical protein
MTPPAVETSELQRLLDERACEQLINEYCRRVDFGNARAIADLFTEDGEWEGVDLKLTGREEIRDWFTRRENVTRRVSRHVCTNVMVQLTGEDEAESVAYMINYRHDRPEGDTSLPVVMEVPKFVGELHDRFRRTPEGWRFSSRRVTLAFVRQRPRTEPH